MNELDELKAFLIKIIMPSLVALSMKIAIMNKTQKVTLFQVSIAFISGVGSAYLSGGLIMDSFSDNWIPLCVAVVTISGEKIGHWVIYKFNVEEFLSNWIKKHQ